MSQDSIEQLEQRLKEVKQRIKVLRNQALAAFPRVELLTRNPLFAPPDRSFSTGIPHAEINQIIEQLATMADDAALSLLREQAHEVKLFLNMLDALALDSSDRTKIGRISAIKKDLVITQYRIKIMTLPMEIVENLPECTWLYRRFRLRWFDNGNKYNILVAEKRDELKRAQYTLSVYEGEKVRSRAIFFAAGLIPTIGLIGFIVLFPTVATLWLAAAGGIGIIATVIGLVFLIKAIKKRNFSHDSLDYNREPSLYLEVKDVGANPTEKSSGCQWSHEQRCWLDASGKPLVKEQKDATSGVPATGVAPFWPALAYKKTSGTPSPQATDSVSAVGGNPFADDIMAP